MSIFKITNFKILNKKKKNLLKSSSKNSKRLNNQSYFSFA